MSYQFRRGLPYTMEIDDWTVIKTPPTLIDEFEYDFSAFY
jgi:hypothetical protein